MQEGSTLNSKTQVNVKIVNFDNSLQETRNNQMLTVMCEFCAEPVEATRGTLLNQGWELGARECFCPLHAGI